MLLGTCTRRLGGNMQPVVWLPSFLVAFAEDACYNIDYRVVFWNI